MKISRLVCYIGFVFIVSVSIYLGNLLTSVFAMVCLLWFHFNNVESDIQEREYKQFMSLK